MVCAGEPTWPSIQAVCLANGRCITSHEHLCNACHSFRKIALSATLTTGSPCSTRTRFIHCHTAVVALTDSSPCPTAVSRCADQTGAGCIQRLCKDLREDTDPFEEITIISVLLVDCQFLIEETWRLAPHLPPVPTVTYTGALVSSSPEYTGWVRSYA